MRVSGMLNFNLQQLCGPKCRDLKVQHAATMYEYLSKVVPLNTSFPGDVGGGVSPLSVCLALPCPVSGCWGWGWGTKTDS